MASNAGPQAPVGLQEQNDAADAVHDQHPQPSPSSAPSEKDDADTCRICRGESTSDEPLFYPCKCSGSIKYVHQECLMEWLSHSQKKYCELCKTSFRFTKLYHPGMPTRIPTSVFVRRAGVHVLKLFITWCRAVTVGFVWLILLPWCMRCVWRSIFWVGDGGWTAEFHSGIQDQHKALSPFDLEAMRSARESARAANETFELPSLDLITFTSTLNITTGEPTVWSLFKRFFLGISEQRSASDHASSANQTIHNVTANPLGPSLLSEITFFNWFPSRTANRILVDVLEGQIITLLVVVAFILIFLIREWVVQQQPVLNMVALGDAVAQNRAPEHAEHVVEQEDDIDIEQEEHEEQGEQGEHAQQDEDASDDDEDSDSDSDEEDSDGDLGQRQEQEESMVSISSDDGQRMAFQLVADREETPQELKEALQNNNFEHVRRIVNQMPREQSLKFKKSIAQAFQLTTDVARRTNTPPDIPLDPPFFPGRSSSLPESSESSQDDHIANSPTLAQRPNMPERDRSFIATEIRRGLEEDQLPPLAETVSRNDSPWFFDGASRDVGEGSRQGPSGLFPSNSMTGPDREHDSENSSESWQQIPDHFDEDILDEERAKGKSRTSAPGDELTTSVGSSSNSPANDNLQHQPHVESSTPTNQSSRDSDASQHEVNPLEPQEVAGDWHAQDPEQQPEHVHDGQGMAPADQPLPGLLDRFMDWVFGDIAPAAQAAEDAANDEHIVQDIAEEAPFVPAAGNEPREPANPPQQDAEVAAAAAQAGVDVVDQDAIDDAEDLEGIMELIGMQGPLHGLVQNAMFSAVLISATLACAVWLPYLWGKMVILFMGSPISLLIKLPLQLIATATDFAIDTALVIAAGLVYWVLETICTVISICTWGLLSRFTDGPINLLKGPARNITESAMDRLAKLTVASTLPRPNTFRLSVSSHLALRSLQNSTSVAFNHAGNAIAAICSDVSAETPSSLAYRMLVRAPQSIMDVSMALVHKCSSLLSWSWHLNSFKITLDISMDQDATAVSAAAEPWSATDRLITIIAGYAFFALLGAIYLKRGSPFSSSQQGQKVERIVLDVLQQAGGVLKVILIISIEMLAFPLYCGVLLDLALLPLFPAANLFTRWKFAQESPWTSGFVHWFIGTCYMFHFALFVSMCRKIMRRGVLYFIRDPDDPTFHPVRDVLERNVTTQLRKIAFSALVYGALVIVCLGGVVWTLDKATTGVLPIHWTSEAPAVEFPLDLLFYNFLTPVVIRLYKPSDGLHAVSQWWFQTCARYLRLSHFLFGEKVKEEEGRHVRRSWSSWLVGRKGDPEQPVTDDGHTEVAQDSDAYFKFEGKYVRAPASDQVRIPKGEPVFVEVDENNARKDGKPEEGGVHNSDMVSMVYIPPWFRLRIAAFVVTIWIFAAITGISVTIIPLILGRHLFALLLPPTVEMNDIHAFSLGIYTLGSVIYAIYYLHDFLPHYTRTLPSTSTLRNFASCTTAFAYRALRFTYVWASFLFFIPLLCAVLLELYFLMPLHAYLGPSEPHVVHLIQDWTLGFLYARLAARLLVTDRASRPARAFSAVVRDGYFNPNARIATRCFLVPLTAVWLVAVLFPLVCAFTIDRVVYYPSSGGANDAEDTSDVDEAWRSQLWRLSYPAVGISLLAGFVVKEGVDMVGRWRNMVRDEVYLIGERLHNFGERRLAAPSGDRGFAGADREEIWRLVVNEETGREEGVWVPAGDGEGREGGVGERGEEGVAAA